MYTQPYQFGTPQPAQPQAIVVREGPRHHHHHHRRRSRSRNGHRHHHHHHRRPRSYSFNNPTSSFSPSPYPYATTNALQQPQSFIPGPQIAAPQPQMLTGGQGAFFDTNIASGQAHMPLAPYAGYGYDYRHHHHHHLFRRPRSVPYSSYASQGTTPMYANAGPIMGQQQVYPAGYQYAGGVGGYGVQNGMVPTEVPIQTATTGYGGAYGGVPTTTSVVL